MSSIPAFKASLIQNYEANKPSKAPTVEEILAGTPAAAQSNLSSVKENRSIIPKVVTAGVALAALGFAGRKGLLSKRVQKLLGGKPKVTKEQIKNKINSALADYVDRNGGENFKMSVRKNGKVRADRVDENGITERITFNPNTGLPEMRILSNNGKNGDPLQYTVWKGADILDEGFDEVNNYYKIYSRSGIKRKYPFGPKISVEKITYGNMVKGLDEVQIERKTRYYKDGTIDRITETDSSLCSTTVQDLLYDKKGKLKGHELISDDGNIIRTIFDESSIPVRETNRKTSGWQKFVDIFARGKKNVID